MTESRVESVTEATDMRRLIIALSILFAATAPSPARHRAGRTAGVAATAHDWPQFNFDAQHSGTNPDELAISPGNVGELQLRFRSRLPAVSDGSPVYWTADKPRRAEHVLFFTATNGALLAMHADGELIWQTTPPDGPRWTTSSPVLDPARTFVYSYALDGRVHKYRIGSGQEVREGVWPVLVTRKPDVEKGSSALSVATARDGMSYLYAAIAGYPDPGDAGDYQGHIVAIRLDDGSSTTFNVVCSARKAPLGYGDCSSRQAGVWSRPGVVYDDAHDSVYVVTSNGPFDGKTKWGDSILRLSPDLRTTRGRPIDSYTPDEYGTLDREDLDLGSGGIALAGRPGASQPSVAVHAGKDGIVRLVSLDDLSGHHAPGWTGGELQRIPLPQGDEVLTAPAVWIDDGGSSWVYFATDAGISALELIDDGVGPRLAERWRSAEGSRSSPVVANGVLYAARNGRIFALDAMTGNLLWSDDSIGNIHWQSPIVANGALYISDYDGNVWSWAVPRR